MIVDIRTYNIVPRKMPEYLALFERYAMPVQRRHIGEPVPYPVDSGMVSNASGLAQVVHALCSTESVRRIAITPRYPEATND